MKTRRPFEWRVYPYSGRSAVIPLAEIETELPLAEIYEGVEFSPERLDEEESLIQPN